MALHAIVKSISKVYILAMTAGTLGRVTFLAHEKGEVFLVGWRCCFNDCGLDKI